MSRPELRTAALTRSRASWIALSVSPTMVKLGRPFATKGLLVRARVSRGASYLDPES